MLEACNSIRLPSTFINIHQSFFFDFIFFVIELGIDFHNFCCVPTDFMKLEKNLIFQIRGAS